MHFAHCWNSLSYSHIHYYTIPLNVSAIWPHLKFLSLAYLLRSWFLSQKKNLRRIITLLTHFWVKKCNFSTPNKNWSSRELRFRVCFDGTKKYSIQDRSIFAQGYWNQKNCIFLIQKSLCVSPGIFLFSQCINWILLSWSLLFIVNNCCSQVLCVVWSIEFTI